MEVKKLVRVFEYGKRRLEDPGATMAADDVRKHYASIYPELTTAHVTGPEYKDNEAVYKLTTGLKPKG